MVVHRELRAVVGGGLAVAGATLAGDLGKQRAGVGVEVTVGGSVGLWGLRDSGPGAYEPLFTLWILLSRVSEVMLRELGFRGWGKCIGVKRRRPVGLGYRIFQVPHLMAHVVRPAELASESQPFLLSAEEILQKAGACLGLRRSYHRGF